MAHDLLQNHVGGAVPHLAAGDVAVFDVDDGVGRILALQIVDHHLAVGAELGGQGGGHLLEYGQLMGFQNGINLPLPGLGRG